MGVAATRSSRRLGVEAEGAAWSARVPWDWVAFAALAVLAAVAIARFGRSWSFFYDEWGVILYRRSGGLPAFFAPLNGHLVAVPIAIYRLLFATVGLRSYTPYRWMTIAAHLGLVALVYAYARRRVPSALALIAVAPLLFLGYAWEVLFWMMNLGFVIPLIAFVAILLIDDRETGASGSARAGASKALLLAVALASSGLGVAVAAGTLVDTLGVRRRWRELPWLAAPVLGYVLWFFLYRPGAETPAALRRLPGASPNGDVGALGLSAGNLDRLPHYAASLAESAAGGLVGARAHWFWLALVAGLVVVGVLMRRRITTRFVALAVALAVFWLLTSLVRAQVGQPSSSRYVYPGAVLLVLLLVEAWSGFAWTRLGLRTRRVGVAILACLAVVAIVSGVRHLEKVGDGARTLFARTNLELVRLSCPGDRLPPAYAPDPTFIPYVRSAPYTAATRDLGSPVPVHVVRGVCGQRS